MLLGKIIQSHDHMDYLCQIYRTEEIEQAPSAQDYAFGQFVAIDLPGGDRMIGIIYNTQLFNPDFGRMGPRLSPESALEIFSPDYLEERALLIAIAALGIMKPDGTSRQGAPALTPEPDALVHRLSDEGVRSFHLLNNRLQLSYAPLLLGRRINIITELILIIIRQLNELFPDQQKLLRLLHDDFLWQARVAPVGGDV
jgi:hypothetical protein